MYKTNVERNGSSLLNLPLEGIKENEWKLEDFRLASADKNVVVDSDFLYCIGARQISGFASIYKIDAKTGRIHSSLEIKEEIKGETRCFSSLVLMGELAFFLYQPVITRLRPKLYCINTKSLEIIYAVDIYTSLGEKYVEGTVHSFKRWVRSSILLVDDSVYIGTGNGCVCSFNTDNGQLRWSLTISDDFAIGHLAYSDGLLYIESSNRDLYAIDVTRKVILWKFDCREGPKTYLNWYNLCPVISEDIVYVFSNLKAIYAVDKKTGELRWEYSIQGGFPCNEIVVTKQLLLAVMPDLTIHCLNTRNGEKQWEMEPGNGFSSPIVMGDTLLINGGSRLYGIDVTRGERKFFWKIPFNKNKMSDPVHILNQVFNIALRTTAKRDNARISTPCISKEGIFVAAENGTDFSLFKLSTQS